MATVGLYGEVPQRVSENCALPETPSAFAVDRVATHGSALAIPARVEEHLYAAPTYC